MKLRNVLAAILFWLMSYPLSAAVIYQFNFSELKIEEPLSDGTHVHFDDFSVTFTYDDYIKTTGLGPTNLAPQPTSLGYDINFCGTSAASLWAFDDDGAAKLEENNMEFNGTSFLIHLQSPEPLTDYITTPGTYLGWVYGNAHFLYNEEKIIRSILGEASLIVTEVIELPEPSGLLLFLLSICGVLFHRFSGIKPT